MARVKIAPSMPSASSRGTDDIVRRPATRSLEASHEARYLLLASDQPTQGAHSGYTRLADYMPNSHLIAESRADPSSLAERGIVRLLDAFAASRWYRLASAKLEWRALRHLHGGFQGLVHFLWAERDWGFLDRILPKRWNSVLCATFHSCPDTFDECLRRPQRLKELSAVLLMSESQRAFFEAHGVDAKRVHVIHHGVDCRYFSPPDAPRPEGFVVLFVGSYRRNFVLLREVCRGLQRHGDIVVKIVAPPEKTAILRDLRNVVVVSGISDQELLACYRQASCLLMTVDCATANNAIMEAMACGVPIVSENVSGVAEYTTAACASLCEPGSADDLVSAIVALYQRSRLAETMGRAARERALEFDWPVVAERTLRVYETLLDGRG